MNKKARSALNLRIAMLGHKHISTHEGGIEIVVSELSTRMAALGYSVTCYDRSGHHVSGVEYDSNNASEYKGVKIKRVFTINRKGLAAMTSSIIAAIRAAFGEYDVVHIHAEGPAFMCWLPKLLGKKVVVTIHGLDHQRAKWGKVASWYILSGEKKAVRFADEIIVLSYNMQEYFQKTYGRETVYIPNGVDRPAIIPAQEIKKMWGLDKDNYVLFLGRIVPEKGLRYLIEAWKNVMTNKKLVITGGSSDTDAFMNELKVMSSGNVIFTGFQEGRVLKELYSNTYIYILPSDLEGMPLSLLEAMSYGNCCIVSDIAECAEVVEDKAVVFSHGNVEDLREKLQSLLDNPERTEAYRAEAADYIIGKYNWDNVVEKTMELYRK